MGESQIYPNRQAYFAHRYCRLLTKSCAAQEIGHVAFTLCVTVAHQEDAKRYTGAVTYFNEQLMAQVGVSKWVSLARARERAVKAGWLHYESGNRGQRMPGRYWVTIPEHLVALDDSPCDEGQYPPKGDRTPLALSSKGVSSGVLDPSQYPPKGDRGGDRGGEHSTLSLSLCNKASNDADAPTKKVEGRQVTKRFTKPTPEDVRAYCTERQNTVDAERFLDYYEANGWRVGKNPMRDWKAAVRTWEKNGFSNGEVKKAEPLKYRG